MTNTPFSKQVEIVADFYLNMGGDYPELISLYDLGFPFAVGVSQGSITALSDRGNAWITETFEAICEELGIDKYGEYDSLNDMVELSNEQG